MTFYTHGFEGQIERFGVGKDRKVWYKVLFLPKDVEQELPFSTYPRLRVIGEIGEVPVAGAFMPTGEGRKYFIVSPAVCRGAKVDVGATVEMRFSMDDQDRVDIPDELAKALQQDEELKRQWDQLTPGKKRGLVHPLHSARSFEAREKQLLLAIEAIMTARHPKR